MNYINDGVSGMRHMVSFLLMFSSSAITHTYIKTRVQKSFLSLQKFYSNVFDIYSVLFKIFSSDTVKYLLLHVHNTVEFNHY